MLAYRFPDDRLDSLLANMAPVVKRSRDSFISCDVSPCAFEMYWRLREMEDAMLDYHMDSTTATMFERYAPDLPVRLAEAACAPAPGLVVDRR